MSRCYPYPPPGYTPSRAGKEALIESIKLQKEKPKTQKNKEKRREKEDGRKMRKDESYEIGEKTGGKTDPNSNKRRKREEGREEKREEKIRRRKERKEKPDLNTKKLDFPNGQIGKTIWENTEQLEGSGLTEEHDQPVRLNLPSTSSESTENSSKRKKQPSAVKVIRGHGNIIRIQLSSKKNNLPDISSNEQQLCSTSGRTNSIPPLRNRQINFCISTENTDDFLQGDLKRTDLKQLVSASEKPILDAAPTTTGTPSVLDVIEGSKKSSGSKQYKNLIENWVPPSMQDANFSPEDLDWLLCKDQGLLSKRRPKFENDSVFGSSGSSLLQPRAQFLPEIDVYALPYTVPY